MRTVMAVSCLAFGAVALGCTMAGVVSATNPPDGPPTAQAVEVAPGARILPQDLVYRGAFRLPEDGDRPRTFAYGGAAMTFRQDGDPAGPQDGFPGSLFITGHDRLPYGELPDGDQVAEVSIPMPLAAGAPSGLNRAEFLQPFAEVTQGRFDGLDEIPRVGLLYLDSPATGPLVHIAFGQHLAPDPWAASHAWFRADLSSPEPEGAWFLEGFSTYAINGYMLEIPSDWAAAYVQGRVVGTGRYRDGGWSGMGPALYAYRPWQDDGSAPAPGATLEATELLHYQASDTTTEIVHAVDGYQHPDEWEGAAWLTTASGGSAVLFAGTKGSGERYWYGYLDPDDPARPCPDADMIGQFAVCRTRDGGECPAAEVAECPSHNDYRGWWSSRFDAQFLLYDPVDLARVARGEMQAWEPQPYAALDIDEHLFLNPDAVEADMLGTGDQRRYRIGEVAYDRRNGYLYVLELFADGAQPVVHVWQVQ